MLVHAIASKSNCSGTALWSPRIHRERQMLEYAVTQDRTGDLQIFSLTLSQLSYRGHVLRWLVSPDIAFVVNT